MRRKTHFDRDGLHFAPFVLFPSPFPETEFDSAVNLQLVVNKLFHKVCVSSRHNSKLMQNHLPFLIPILTLDIGNVFV